VSAALISRSAGVYTAMRGGGHSTNDGATTAVAEAERRIRKERFPGNLIQKQLERSRP